MDAHTKEGDLPRSPEGRLANVLIWIGALAMIAMMLNICADVAARFFLGTPITGTLELVTYLYMISVVFLPLAMTQLEERHVIVEVFSQRLPGPVIRWIDRFAMLLSAGYVGFIGWWGMQEAIRATARNEVITIVSTDVPLWPTRWLIPLGLLAMLVVVMAQLLRSFLRPKDPARTAG